MYAWIDQKDLAFESLTKGLQESDSAKFFNEMFYDPLFQNLHDDPRWNVFLEKTGTSPAQLSSIDFDIELPR
jgi:hypothetical protein